MSIESFVQRGYVVACARGVSDKVDSGGLMGGECSATVGKIARCKRMRVHLSTLALLLTAAVFAPASAGAARHGTRSQPTPPKLIAIPGSVSGYPGRSSTVLSDGVRYVSFRLTSGQTAILDTKTGHRYQVPASVCPEVVVSEETSPALRPEVMTGGEMLSACDHTPTVSPRNSLLVTALPSLLTVEAKFRPAFFPSPYLREEGILGSQWARYVGCEPESYGLACTEETLFNFVTGATYPKRIRSSTTTFANLNASGSTPIQRLCSPVRLTHPGSKDIGINVSERLYGVEGPWVLITQFRAKGNRESTRLLAWHCGTRHPITLGTVAESPQLGANLVSWFDEKWVLHVVDLTTRKQLDWVVPHTSEIHYICVHTASAVFVVEQQNAHGRPVFTASLKGLGETSYIGPAPAVIARPAPKY